jgi:hypothetical protein
MQVHTEPVAEMNKSKANTKHMSPAEVQGMVAALFRCAERRRVLISYTGSLSSNPVAQISVLNFDTFQNAWQL